MRCCILACEPVLHAYTCVDRHMHMCVPTIKRRKRVTRMVYRKWHDKMRRSMRDSREREGREIEREEDKESEIAI